jgi:predicted enzyme related to lactoylglutathione lyase
MSERDAYEPGVPCWVDSIQADAEAARDFYAGVFGWEYETSGDYSVARLRGRDIAGILAQADAPSLPSWNTHVSVASADEAAAKVRKAGGAVLFEPFDVAPAGRMAVVADPQGASFSLWESGTRHGAQLVNEPGAWTMSVLATPDPAGAAAFYGTLFGWTTEAFGPMTMFRLPGYVGGEPQQPVSREVIAVMRPADDGERPGWHAGFWVSDVDEAAASAERLGGSALSPPGPSPTGRAAVLADPAGIAFGVSQVS